jgi:Leucine-rich repeat (LRR) protein
VRNSNFCKDQSSDCQLSSDIERLTSLEELSIINTKVTHLPTSFGRLERLKILGLMSTDLVTLPNTFSNLQSLSSLTIYYSKMTSLPMTVGKISSLRTMYLDNNAALRSIQSLNGLQNLIILSAINCSITRIPLDLPKVYYLYMTNNKLTNLNGIETLGSTTNDTKLFAFEINQISALPANIGSVYKLSVLRVNGNKLTNLPSEIYDINTLIILDIQHNLFTTTRLEAIVAKFKITNPSLMLIY